MKELTIEEKAQRYDKAIKVAENIHRFSSDLAEIKRMEEIFPELKESEDAKIRKTLIEYFNAYPKDYFGGLKKSYILAWLEKQGKETKWKPSKEEMDVLYGLSYITDQYDEQKEQVIIRLYQDLKREFFNGASYENMFPTNTSIEDDVRRRSTIQVLEYAKSLDAYNQYGKADINKNIAWLEKQGEQPSAIRWYDVSLIPQEMEELLVEWDSEDATWHEIAFYHADTKTFWNGTRQVENVTRWCYIIDLLEKQGESALIEEIKRRKELLLSEKEKALSISENLSLGGRIAMLEELLAFVNEKQGEHKPAENKGMNLVEGEMTPFQKKVFCIIDTTVEEEQGLKQVCDELLRLAHNEIMNEQKPWSEEDETRLQVCIDCLQAKSLMGKVDTVMTNWLKSLKERYTWKPSDEQMKALHDLNLTGNLSYAGQGQVLIELYNDLKNLKGE